MCILQKRREDTRFELAHFYKHRRKIVKKLQGKEGNPISQRPEEKDAPGKHSKGNRVASAVGRAAELAVGAKPRKVGLHMPVPSISMLSCFIIEYGSKFQPTPTFSQGRFFCSSGLVMLKL